MLLAAVLVATGHGEQVRSSLDGRYSYSLSFFDPNGKLGQVERAMQAASQGIPILVVARKDHVVMVAPQIMPFPFCHQESGTQRFVRLTPSILLAHSGITADGRVLMTAAQRLAIEHEFVFDELIPVEVFLEEMSLLYQEYTMKQGVRPFGASLIVASLHEHPKIYRIDPSGSVTYLGSSAVVNGGSNRKSAYRMQQELDTLYQSSEAFSEVEDLKTLVAIVQKELEDEMTRKTLLLDRANATESMLSAVAVRSAVLLRATGIAEFAIHPGFTASN